MKHIKNKNALYRKNFHPALPVSNEQLKDFTFVKPLSAFETEAYCKETFRHSSFAWELMNKLPIKVYTENIFNNDDDLIIWWHPTKKAIHISMFLTGMSHELAHFIETPNINRLVKNDFDLQLGLGGNKYTFAVLIREVKVRAIQRRIGDFPERIMSITERQNEREATIITNAILDQAIRYLPYGRFSCKEELIQYVYDLHDRTYDAWNKDRIETVFNKRAEFVKNWMETI